MTTSGQEKINSKLRCWEGTTKVGSKVEGHPIHKDIAQNRSIMGQIFNFNGAFNANRASNQIKLNGESSIQL